MELLHKYSKHIPYLYFIAFIGFWFTLTNRASGIIAYPILLFGIPFLWQLFRPNKYSNFLLGIYTHCILGIFFIVLAFYFVSTSLTNSFETYPNKHLLLYGGFLIPANFLMALWIVRNSLKRSF